MSGGFSKSQGTSNVAYKQMEGTKIEHAERFRGEVL